MKNMIKKIMSSRGRIFNSDVVISANLKKYSRDCFGALLLAMTMFVTACDNKETAAPEGKPTIKIGAILPLSGNLSEIGEVSNVLIDKVKDGAKNSPINFEILVEDNNMDIKKTIMVANKMLNLDKVNVIVSAFTGPSTAVTPIVKDKNVFHICVANDCNVSLNKNSFANWQNVSVASQKMIALLNSKQAKKVIIFTMEDAGTNLISDSLRKDLKQANIEFSEVRFNPQERDFSFLVEKASKEENVDYWILNTLSPGLEIIRRNMINKGIKTPITAIQTFGDAQNKTLFEGFEYVESAPVDEELKEYIKSKGLKSENITVGAYVYDSLNMIIKAVENFYDKNKRLPNADEISQELLRMKKYNGAVGEVIIPANRIMISDTVITKL